MTIQPGGTATDQEPAAERIEEARRLIETISETLTTVRDLAQAGNLKDVDLLPRQVARLTDAIADLKKREAEFNEKFGAGLADGDIDFDDVRYQIGCRLSRIRECCKAA